MASALGLYPCGRFRVSSYNPRKERTQPVWKFELNQEEPLPAGLVNRKYQLLFPDLQAQT